MTNFALHRETAALLKPEPHSRGGAVSIRAAVESDLAFIDALQKRHGKAVAFASTKELRSYIDDGTALLAIEEASGESIGYCLYRDRYMKREDCGIVSQLVVDSSRHRGLVGAAMIQAMFERLPYGVRLFCLWCAQDLDANHFWEALGFVPLAFRAGSRGRTHGGNRKETRMQIFWQRRVRKGDAAGGYPYWFPSQTMGGRMREGRIVLPIPPGTHWSDAKPAVLPGWGAGMEKLGTPALRAGSAEGNPGESGSESRGTAKRERKPRTKAAPPPTNPVSTSGGLWFAPPPPSPEEIKAAKAAEPKPKRERQKNDPKLVAMAREFRDRYLDEVNTGRFLPDAWGAGKYDVSRQLIEAPVSDCLQQVPLLEQKRAA